MSGVSNREVDRTNPQDLGIAFAMVQTGFSEADIVSVLGYMPNLAITAAELDELERQIEDDDHSPQPRCPAR